MGSECHRTEQAFVSTVQNIVRSRGVNILKAKEKARINRIEKNRQRRFSTRNNNSDNNSNNNGNINEKIEIINNTKNSKIEMEENFDNNNCEKFSLTLSVPFLHVQHVRTKPPGTNSVRGSDDTAVKEGDNGDNYNTKNNDNNDDINSNIRSINNNNNKNNTNDKIVNNNTNNSNTNNNNTNNSSNNNNTHNISPASTDRATLTLESSTLNSIYAFSAALSPCSDGWTPLNRGQDGDGKGGKNPTPFGPIRPLFYPPQREEDNSPSSYLILKNTQIPCSGPGHPISPHNSGAILVFLFYRLSNLDLNSIV